MEFLQAWFASHCDGDWEQDERVRICNLDNPGWELWIDFTDTELEGRLWPQTQVDRSEIDWLHYRADGDVFYAACGPSNLSEAVEAFRAFVEGDPASGAI